MTAIMIAIVFTTGACAFMFFVLPYIDGKLSEKENAVNHEVVAPDDDH